MVRRADCIPMKQMFKFSRINSGIDIYHDIVLFSWLKTTCTCVCGHLICSINLGHFGHSHWMAPCLGYTMLECINSISVCVCVHSISYFKRLQFTDSVIAELCGMLYCDTSLILYMWYSVL